MKSATFFPVKKIVLQNCASSLLGISRHILVFSPHTFIILPVVMTHPVIYFYLASTIISINDPLQKVPIKKDSHILHSMTCSQVAEALQSACHPSSSVRLSAEKHLKYLLEHKMAMLFQQLFKLLKSLDQNIQTLSFSYLLNIIRTKKANKMFNNFLFEVETAYVYFDFLLEEEITFGRERFKLQKSNIIRLAHAYYSDISYIKEREELVFKVVQLHNNSKSHILVHFYNQLLHAIAEQVPPYIAMRSGARLAAQLRKTVLQFWDNISPSKKQLALGASYYLAVASSDFFRQVSRAINADTPPSLLRKIIARLASIYQTDPGFSLELNINIFLSGLQLALMLEIERIQDDKLEELTKMLMGSLKAIVGVNKTEMADAIIVERVLKLQIYRQVVGWLFQLVHYMTISNDHSEINITDMAISIIQMFNDHLPDTVITQFFETFNLVSEEAMLSLLCGANHIVMNHFDHIEVARKIVKRNQVISQQKNIIYFIFILKSLKLTRHISSEDYQNTGNFLLLQLEAIKENFEDNQQRHLLSLSYLYQCLVQLCYYPFEFAKICLPQQLLRMLIRTSQLGATSANDNMIEAVKSLANFNIDFKHQIFSNCFQILTNNFENLRIKGPLKWQTQVMSILRETLTSQDIRRPEIVYFLIETSKIAEVCNSIMGKEIIQLLGDAFRHYNNLLYACRSNPTQMNFLPKLDMIDATYLGNTLSDLLFSQSFTDIFELFQSKVEDLFTSGIQGMVNNYLEAIKLLLQLSLHTQYHNCINYFLVNLLEFIERDSKFFYNLQSKSKNSTKQTKIQVNLLGRIPRYVQCLAEVTFINPAWRHASIITEDKKKIENMNIFNSYVKELIELSKKDLDIMMQRISLQDPLPPMSKWSVDYPELLVKSSIEEIFYIWLKQFSRQFD